MKNINKFTDKAQWPTWVGKEISKWSNKPFKSGSKVGKVIEFTTNPYSGKEAFKMCDGSIVDCHQCHLKK